MSSDSEDDSSALPSHFGILKKRNRHVWGDTYSSRFFTMFQNVLCYFTKREALSEKISVKEYVRRFQPKAIYDLSDAIVKTSGANFISIEFRDERQLELHCADIRERDIWAHKLISSIKLAKDPVLPAAPETLQSPRSSIHSPTRPARSPRRSNQRSTPISRNTSAQPDDNEIPDRLLTQAIYKVLRDVQRLNPGWELVKVCNGLRIYEDKASNKIPTFKAIGVVYAPPRDVFKLMMDNSELRKDWDLTFNNGSICSEDTPNSDTVRVETNPLQLYPLFADPREFAYYRYWKREDDGSYSIILSPPTTVLNTTNKPGVVQAEMFGGCILISPSDDDEGASVVTYALQLDPKAFHPHVRLYEVLGLLLGCLGSWGGFTLLRESPVLGVGLAIGLMVLVTLYFGRELLCAVVGVSVTAQLRMGFVRAFHVEMLMAVAGLRDMINQTPGLDQLLEDSSEIGSIWMTDTELPRKRPSESPPVSQKAPKSSPSNTTAAVAPKVHRSVSSDEMFAKLRAAAAKHSWFGSGPSDLSGKHCWADLPGDDFIVRGPNYLNDKKKIPSDGSLMPVVCVELLPVSDLKSNICAHPKGFVQRVRKMDWGPAGPPFLFCVQFFVPCSPTNYMLNIYCARDPSKPSCRAQEVLDRFMAGGKPEQDTKFKLIPRVAEGGWFVRKACGDPPTPAIMGTKVQQNCHRGPGYFEVDFDLGASSVAGGIIKIVTGPAKSLVVDLAFLVESQTAEELPEKLLMVTRLARVDLPSAEEHKNPYETVAFNIGRR